MNLVNTNQPLTMTSQQIADLVESRHDSVKRTIDRLVTAGAIEKPPAVEIQTSTKPAVVYQVGKRDSYVIVAQLSPAFTAKLVDRWQELENQAPALPDFSNPVEAARAWADAKEAEQKALVELEQAKPAVEFVGKYVDAGNTVPIRAAAKTLGFKERAFIDCLMRDKYLYRLAGNLTPYANSKTAGLFECKTGERNGHAYNQARVTPAGIAKFAQVYATELGE